MGFFLKELKILLILALEALCGSAGMLTSYSVAGSSENILDGGYFHLASSATLIHVLSFIPELC